MTRGPARPSHRDEKKRSGADSPTCRPPTRRLPGRGLPVLTTLVSLLALASNAFAVSKTQPPRQKFTFRFPHHGLRSYETIPILAAHPDTYAANVNVIEAGLAGAMELPVLLHNRVVLQLAPGTDLATLLSDSPLGVGTEVASNIWILQAGDAWTAAEEAARLATLPGVAVCHPVMQRSTALNGAYAPKPKDSLYYVQWPLENRELDGAAAGADLNIRAAWPLTRGEGVTVAVADTGVDLGHQELAGRADAEFHYDFILGTPSGNPLGTDALSAHGTEVAGLLLAERDNHRIVGVAPEARLASWVIFDTNVTLAAGDQLMQMYQFRNDEVPIQNHSWSSSSLLLEGPTLEEEVGLSNAWRWGRSGLGVVMVRPAGNDRLHYANANEDGYANDPRIISVAAVGPTGRAASYSEPGACLWIAAPGGEEGSKLVTTDLRGHEAGAHTVIQYPPPNEDLPDYVFNEFGFVGTSAAVPQVSGVAALMLALNPNLHRRDVQWILALSARHLDFADPDLATNGVGLRLSHNVGFGIPDAGEAVRLARLWPGVGPETTIVATSPQPALIPDDGLRVETSGDGVPTELLSLSARPGTGPHPDVPTAALPLVDAGLCLEPPAVDLTGKGALIRRGGGTFATKLTHAAHAGAAFAVVYNYPTNDPAASPSDPGGDQLLAMGATDFVPLPALFVGNAAGVRLQKLYATNSTSRTRLQLLSTNLAFPIPDTMICEHVGLWISTDHPSRGDLRFTLVSPMGTRSVLQASNIDTNAGPVDWVYWSHRHLGESSAGTWTVSLADEVAGQTGSALEVSLILTGTVIEDADADGLADDWEVTWWTSLADQGPQDDPDEDGFNNAREQWMGTNPTVEDVPFQLDLSAWDTGRVRLSWPGRPGRTYQVWGGTNVTALALEAVLPPRLPETEWFAPSDAFPRHFYQVRAIAVP